MRKNLKYLWLAPFMLPPLLVSWLIGGLVVLPMWATGIAYHSIRKNIVSELRWHDRLMLSVDMFCGPLYRTIEFLFTSQ